MKNIDFSMTYLALKMFGKQLYANMSAAIAELVANGLDAKAEEIYSVKLDDVKFVKSSIYVGIDEVYKENSKE